LSLPPLSCPSLLPPPSSLLPLFPFCPSLLPPSYPSSDTDQPLTENDTEIVGQGLSMLVEIMLMEPKLWPGFCNYKGIKKWIFLLILKSPENKVREYAATGIVRLVQRTKRLYGVFY
jgi:hypothetical protein